MNKKIGLIASAFLITCIVSLNVFAKTDELIDSSKISTANENFLFKGATNLIVLSEEEMRKTEGEVLPLPIAVGISLAFGWPVGTEKAPTLNNVNSCAKVVIKEIQCSFYM